MKIEHTYLSKQITPNLAVDLVQAQKHVKELESQLSIPVATNPSDLVDANKAGVVKSIVGAAREGLEKWRVDATALQERVHPAGGQISKSRQNSRYVVRPTDAWSFQFRCDSSREPGLDRSELSRRSRLRRHYSSSSQRTVRHDQGAPSCR